MSRLAMGCDPHLDTITAAVVDGTGAAVATVTVPNRDSGWEQLTRMVSEYEIGTVGIEGASGWGRRLAVTLTRRGVEVREMPTRLTARQRRADGAGKTDPGDARTIARAAARGEGSRWVDHDTLETIRVVHARREHLVRAQTADINQLRALIAEIDPATAADLARLRSTRRLHQLTQFTPTHGDGGGDSDGHGGDGGGHGGGGGYRSAVTDLVRDIASGCVERLEQIRRLTRQLDRLLPAAGRQLITIKGCHTVGAASILAQVAGTDGFATDAKMAAWAGTAPLDASSGREERHRLNRGGNRQVNRAAHTIILTQLRTGGEAADYITRRLTEGKTKPEAIRAAKRHLTRRIWKILRDHQLT